MELIKKVFQAVFSAVKSFVLLLFGKHEGRPNKLPLYAALFFLLTCVVMSLNALALAKWEAAQKR